MGDDQETVELRCNVPGLVEKVAELLRSATDADKRLLLSKYPELLSSDADDVLRQIEEAHKRAGRSTDAGNTNGLRFKLERTRLFSFEHACLEQVVLMAFMNLPTDNAGGYLRKITERYPELLKAEADRAVLTLKELFASREAGYVMTTFLDLLLERMREQRAHYKALSEGKRRF